jgi:cytochrome c-type biogenesis protein CcmH
MVDRHPQHAAHWPKIVVVLVALLAVAGAFAAATPAAAPGASAIDSRVPPGTPAARAGVAAVPSASGAAPADAPRATPTAADPVLEARMLEITSELRCLVCQNQTIAESHADLAVDLRAEVRELLRAGRTPAEIRRYMTDRYGDFVLYRPPFKPTTLLLWLGPALLLAIGGTALVVALRRRSRLGDDRFEADPALDEPDAGGDATPPPGVRPGAPA